jgi:hypothetical protein
MPAPPHRLSDAALEKKKKKKKKKGKIDVLRFSCLLTSIRDLDQRVVESSRSAWPKTSPLRAAAVRWCRAGGAPSQPRSPTGRETQTSFPSFTRVALTMLISPSCASDKLWMSSKEDLLAPLALHCAASESATPTSCTTWLHARHTWWSQPMFFSISVSHRGHMRYLSCRPGAS